MRLVLQNELNTQQALVSYKHHQINFHLTYRQDVWRTLQPVLSIRGSNLRVLATFTFAYWKLCVL